jgi:ribosome-associated heat shock protein Hsp15
MQPNPSSSGPGIAPALRSRLFLPCSTGDSGSGSGLGLAICQEIAAALGGSISLETGESHGRIAGLDAPARLPLADNESFMEKLRVDKWLWAARFYKTRSLATEEIGKGRVEVNGAEVKPARELKVGDTVTLRQGPTTRSVVVKGISASRGPAPIAQQLYEETTDSLQARERVAQQRKLAPEPALTIEHGRPTKRGRRELDDARGWGDRWSASIDE